MSATLPLPPPVSRTDPPRALARGPLLFAAYVIVLGCAFASGLAWLQAVAVLMLATLLLWPGLRARGLVAIALWIGAAVGTIVLAASGRGALALDFMPVMVNAALSYVFGRTLVRGRTPLIARVIAVVESPERLALPRVAGYAHALTFAWALLLAAQAAFLCVIIGCLVPGGWFDSFGLAPPFALRAAGWTWYLHLGSYGGVLAFMAIEYAWRRWHLRDIEHLPMPLFAARLARRWPALARGMLHDAPEDAR